MFVREKLVRLVVSFVLLFLLSVSFSAVLQSKEPLTFAIGSVSWREPKEESVFFQEWQKRTGVRIKLIKMDSSAINEKINTMLASGDLPDIMSCTRTIANDYGPQGAFIPINKYFDKAPNLKKYFDVKKNPWLYGPDGNIYILTATWPYLAWGWVWNKKWADKLGVSAPKTIDDWVTVWEKVKASDPKAIPLGTQGTGLLYQFFFPTWWGITSEGLVMERGNLRDPWLTPEMKGLITFLHDIYDKKLLYQEFLTATNETFYSLIAQGKVFSIVHYQGVPYLQAKAPQDVVNALETLPPPKGPYGKSGCDWMGPTSWWGISITSKCKDIDSAVKFLDYLFSKEGTYLYYLGVKGVTYEIAKDGTIRFTQKVIDEAKKANMDLDTYLATNYGINLYFINIPPWDPKLHILHAKAYGQPENYLKGLLIVAKNLAKYRPPIWLTAEEQKRVNSIMSNISTYREEWVSKFILGKEPLTKWDEFISGLKKMGAEEVEQLYNKGYERYLKTVGKPKGYVPPIKYDLTGLDKIVGLSK
jgi:putative aldouronate transport system substrate-binding protein